MARREREILEHAVRTVAEQAVKADELVDEAKAAGGRRSSDHGPREDAPARAPEGEGRPSASSRRGRWTARKCGLDVHWVSGLGVSPGHWAPRSLRRTAILRS